MAEPARRLWSLDEFLAFDDGTDTRYELFDGQIVAMAPASDVRAALVARLVARIGAGLRPPYEVVIEAGIIPPKRADSYYQADLAVTCSGLMGRQFITEPILTVEVLSLTTAATDRERKLPDYRTIPSLQDILVLSSTEPRIEHFRREADGWKIHDRRGQGAVRLQALDITLDLADLYAGVPTAATPPAREPISRWGHEGDRELRRGGAVARGEIPAVGAERQERRAVVGAAVGPRLDPVG